MIKISTPLLIRIACKIHFFICHLDLFFWCMWRLAQIIHCVLCAMHTSSVYTRIFNHQYGYVMCHSAVVWYKQWNRQTKIEKIMNWYVWATHFPSQTRQHTQKKSIKQWSHSSNDIYTQNTRINEQRKEKENESRETCKLKNSLLISVVISIKVSRLNLLMQPLELLHSIIQWLIFSSSL